MNPVSEHNAKSYDEKALTWDKSAEENTWYAYLEKPVMAKLLPPELEHKSVLCIGVGAGDELLEIVKQNPRRLVGIDISEKLLEIAKEKFPSLETYKMDMMELDFPPASFDFMYSSLAFHYAWDWDLLLSRVKWVLKPGGSLLFSTHHPDFWGTKPKTGKSFTNSRNVTLTEHTTTVRAGVEIYFYNHPSVESILESVRHAGFEIIESVVPQPVSAYKLTPTEQEEYDNVAGRNSKTPIFLIIKARKPQD